MVVTLCAFFFLIGCQPIPVPNNVNVDYYMPGETLIMASACCIDGYNVQCVLSFLIGCQSLPVPNNGNVDYSVSGWNLVRASVYCNGCYNVLFLLFDRMSA